MGLFACTYAKLTLGWQKEWMPRVIVEWSVSEMVLYQSQWDNLIIERIGFTIQVRHGLKVIDEMPATMTDYSDTRKAREWIIANVWSGKK